MNNQQYLKALKKALGNLEKNSREEIDELLGRKRPSFKTTQAADHVLRSHSLL